MRNFSITTVLVCLALASNAFAQGGTSTLSGTVEDATGASIPGVTVTATNASTGIATTVLSNESGVYNFIGLQPGVYKATASLPGFQTQEYTGIELGAGVRVRLNFSLKVGATQTKVDVVAPVDTLSTSSSSIGEVLTENRVRELPLLGNDVMDLIGVLAGARVSAAGGGFTTLAGISASYSNTTLNGLSVGDGRYDEGIYSTTRINPDLVGEVRLILTPVDAELGRGNGQIQIQTRSGTNAFHGAAVWNIRNTALDANTWNNNRTVPLPTRNWLNQNQYTLSYGGPLIRGKTFFFVLWDQQIHRERANVNTIVLTDCARNGIFRYYPGWANGNALATPSYGGANPTIPVVDVQGNPIQPMVSPANGAPLDPSQYPALQYVSVFGTVITPPTKPDCSDAVIGGNPWDAARPNLDPTGFIRRTLDLMPRANVFSGGDGLNTATFNWIRRRETNGSATGDTGDDTNRKQINIKVDHNFNANHKIAVQWSYERDNAIGGDADWPGGFSGSATRRPHVATLNFISTLSPTLVNEARWGVRYAKSQQYEALDDPTFGAAARAYTPVINGIPIVVTPGSGAGGTAVSFGGDAYSQGDFTRGNVTPLWNYADTLSWTRGQHSLKFGAELRFTKSDGWSNLNYYPHANGAPPGGITLSPALPVFSDAVQPSGNAGLTGFVGNNNTRMQNLLQFLSGGVAQISQLYFLQHADQLDHFESLLTEARRSRDFRQRELAFFTKDDWLVHRHLTLNIGLRYDYYGSPWENHGLTSSPVGGGYSAFGYSGRSFEDWFRPGQRGELTNFEFVGPNSPHPDRTFRHQDRNNFGPAVGFAWQVPWFGEGKTTVRGGYQITFAQAGGQAFGLDLDLGYIPGSVATPTINSGSNTFVRLADLQNYIPVPYSIKPLGTVPVEYRATVAGWGGEVEDPNSVIPYIQNFTLSITRSLRSNMQLDVRYIGTRGVKLESNIELNSRNFLTNGLKEAFNAARTGGESDLLNRIFNEINIAGTGFGPVGSTFNNVLQTGAMHLRASTATRQALADGNYAGLAGTLNTMNYNRTFFGNSGLPVISDPLVLGSVLRHNGFPENFIVTNPQFNTIGLESNAGSSNYHSLQMQYTLRPTQGFSYQGTFTWSRSMGSPPNGGFSHLPERIEYGLLFGHRSYDFRSNGMFELPFGPNKLLLGNSSGWLARLVERWQASMIVQFTSGRPNTISAQNMLTNTGFGGGTGTPVITPEGVAYFGNFPAKFGEVYWKGGNAGNYFPPDTFVRVPDPQCDLVTPLQNLNGGATPRCTLDAIARPLPDGTTGVPGQILIPDSRSGAAPGATRPGLIVLRNPVPGERGTLGLNSMEGPGLWFFDAALSKTFRIDESKTVQVRFDARNILNHPTPDDPSLAINGDTPFGNIGTKNVAETPARRFQGALRFSF